MNGLPPDKRIKKLAALFYPIPNPLRSEEEWLRLIHQDLDTMTKAELSREYFLVESRLNVEHKPDSWLVQRGERLRTLILTKKHNEK